MSVFHCAERGTEDIKSDYCHSHFDVSGDPCVHDSCCSGATVLAELPVCSVVHQIGSHTNQVCATGKLVDYGQHYTIPTMLECSTFSMLASYFKSMELCLAHSANTCKYVYCFACV